MNLAWLFNTFETGRRPEKSEDELEIVFLEQEDLVVRSTARQRREHRTVRKPKMSEEQHMVVSEENGLTLKSTASQDRTCLSGPLLHMACPSSWHLK